MLALGFLVIATVVFWGAYHLWMDLLTRPFPRSKFRRDSFERIIEPGQRKPLFRRLKRSGFTHAQSGEIHRFSPEGFRKWRLRQLGRRLRIEVRPSGIGWAVRVEMETRKRRAPVAPLVPAARRHYRLFLKSIAASAVARFFILPWMFFRKIGPFFYYAFSFVFVFFLACMLSFFLDPSPELVNELRYPPNPFSGIEKSFYFKLAKNHAGIWFVVNSFLGVLFLSALAFLPVTTKKTISWLYRFRKITAPLAIASLFLFFAWIGNAQLKLEHLQRKALDSPWVARATADVPSEPLTAFCERWKDTRIPRLSDPLVSMEDFLSAMVSSAHVANYDALKSDYMDLACKPLFRPRRASLPSDMYSLDEFLGETSIRKISDISMLIVATSLEEILNGNEAEGMSGLNAVANVHRSLFRHCQGSNGFLVHRLGVSMNSALARLWVGKKTGPDIPIPHGKNYLGLIGANTPSPDISCCTPPMLRIGIIIRFPIYSGLRSAISFAIFSTFFAGLEIGGTIARIARR